MTEYVVRIVKVVSVGAMWYRKRVEANSPEEALLKVHDTLSEHEKIEDVKEYKSIDEC